MTGDQQSQGEVTSLDDFPIAARLVTRQQFLVKWYRGLALAPFVVVLFVVLKFFPDSTSVIPVVLVEATLVWAIAIAGYSFYSTFFGVRCGRCGNRMDRAIIADPVACRGMLVVPNLLGTES